MDGSCDRRATLSDGAATAENMKSVVVLSFVTLHPWLYLFVDTGRVKAV